MKEIKPEDIIAIASIVSSKLAKTCTTNELIQYKTLFQTISNNLQTILFYEIKK